MSKVADLHQDYLDFLETNRPQCDLENGMTCDDMDWEPPTFEEWVEYNKQQERDAALFAAGRCSQCEKPFGRINICGLCMSCMDAYCEAMSGK